MDTKDCFVRIVTCSEGEERTFSAKGIFCRHSPESFSVEYSEDGDAVSVCYGAGRLSMTRRGEVGLRSEFTAGAETETRISLGDGVGIVSAFTDVLQISKDGFHVMLGYRLRFGRGETNFLLNISISLTEVP